MRKLITPFIYGIFLFPLTAIAVGMEAILRSFGILGEYKEVIDLPLFIMFLSTILVFGIPIFLLVNLLMRAIEKSHNSIMAAHFRQSFFFYLIITFCLGSWVVGGFGKTEADGYLLMWIGISFVAIVVNYLFLKRSVKN